MMRRTTGYTRFIMYLAIAVLINLISLNVFFRIDLTKNRRYSLSSLSKKVVSTLSEPLTIKVFFTKNLPAPYNNIERYIRDLLEEYANAENRYFNYRFYSVSAGEGATDEEVRKNQQMAEDYGVYPVQIQHIEHDELKFQNAYMGMVFIHGDLIEKLPAITSTDGLEYKITSTIERMNNKISALINLKDDIKVKLFLSSSLNVVGPYMGLAGLNRLPEEIKGVVERLNTKNYGRLSFIHLDPTRDTSLDKEADKYNILKLQWKDFTDSRGRKISSGYGYAGIVVEYGDKVETIPLIQVVRLPIFGTQYSLVNTETISESIDGVIDGLIETNERIGYLVDHDTLEMPFTGFMNRSDSHPDSISRFIDLLSRSYSIKEVRLDEGIPEGINTLIIAGPKERFTDYELFQIDQFLMKGKSLAIFLDPFKEEMPEMHNRNPYIPAQPSYKPVKTGLERLLEHYGLKVRNSYVLDENCYKQRTRTRMGMSERNIYFAPLIKNEAINHDLSYLRDIKALIILKASPVMIDEDRIKQSGLRADLLFSSSEKSWESSERMLNPLLITPPANDSDKESYSLAYLVEGRFKSYFADKPIPVKEVKEENKKEGEKKDRMPEIMTEGEVIKTSMPAKIFLIGTSEILKNSIIDEEGSQPNSVFVLNVMDYLNGRGSYIEMRSKTGLFNPLMETDPAVKTTIKAVNIAGLPVLVVLSGIIVWFRRSSRKRAIRERFNR
jgi:ABC-type uncharacterized transport system involved in gliding motility auxiliary subunit